MVDLTNILTKYNFVRRTLKPQTTFKEIESQLSFTLPDDYKFFLENYSEFEGSIGPEYVNLWDIDELLTTNKDRGIFDNLPLTLAIGHNPSSEFIAIEYIDKSNYRIVLSPFIDLDRQYHVDIGSSFADFLLRLDKGREWFT